MIKVFTKDGHETDITVELLSIHGGAMVTLVITDQADGEQVMLYDDEIDHLIEILNQLKGEMK